METLISPLICVLCLHNKTLQLKIDSKRSFSAFSIRWRLEILFCYLVYCWPQNFPAIISLVTNIKLFKLSKLKGNSLRINIIIRKHPFLLEIRVFALLNRHALKCPSWFIFQSQKQQHIKT